MSRVSSKLFVLALILVSVFSLVPVSISHALNNEGPTRQDNDGTVRFRNNAAFGDSYPGTPRQMDYVVSNDDYTDIFVSDILIYQPQAAAQIRITGADLCTGASAPGIRNSDGNYVNAPAGRRVTDFYLYRGTTSTVPIDSDTGVWNYGPVATCANDGSMLLTATGGTVDPDTGMYIYRLSARANLVSGGKFANGFHVTAMAGSYISQDSSKRTQHFGLQPSQPIPVGSNPQVKNPPNPYKVYTDVDIPFGPDCSLPVGSTRNVSFDIYDSDNVNNLDVQPQPFNIRVERYTRAGTYRGSAPMVGIPTRAISLGGGVYQPTSGNQQTSTFTFKADGGEKYILRVNRLYYDNTLQFSIPFDSVFFFKQCQSATTSTVRPTATLSPDVVQPGQMLTGTSSIAYVGPVNTPAQVDARRLVWSDTIRNGLHDPSEPIHFDQTTPYTIPAAGQPLPPWTDTADPGKYGSRVCFGLFLTPTNPTTRTVPASDSECSEISKKPKVQIHGGDVRVRGKIETSLTPFDDKQFGSWVEYGAFANGASSGFGSGAGLNNGNASLEPKAWNQLTFANIDNSRNPSFGLFSLAPLPPEPPMVAQFRNAPSSGAPNGNLGSLGSGTYNTANLTITPSTVGQQAGKGKKIVIIATGTVTITGDITYQAPSGNTFTNLDQIPQVVIIANKIDIRGSAKNIDAWLLTTGATGAINTCSDVALAAPLNTSICPDRLTVNGPVSTAHLYLRRTGGSGTTAATAGDPAELFNLRADAYLWGRTQAAQNGKAQTVYSVELPPRF
jgi:hypothetical protein